MTRRKRKVVPGSQVWFQEDIRLSEAALLTDPPLPRPDFLPLGELVILFRDRLLRLAPTGDSDHSMSLCGKTFPIVEIGTVRSLEDGFLASRSGDDFVRSVLPALLDEKERTAFHRQYASLACEFLDARIRAGAEPAKPPIPAEGFDAPSPPSILVSLRPAFDRSLFLDGRRYDLQTPVEFFDAWQRGFHPSVAEEVHKDNKVWTAKDLSRHLLKQEKLSNPRTLSVVRSRLHTRIGPPQIRLAGLDWIPEPREKADRFETEWRRVLAYAFKRRALEPHTKP